MNLNTTPSINPMSRAVIAVMVLAVLGAWVVFRTEVHRQEIEVIEAWKKSQLVFIRTSANNIEAYTRLRNPHRIEIVSGWYERELYTRFIADLRILEDGCAWLLSGTRLTCDDMAAILNGGQHFLVPVTGADAPQNLLQDSSAILQEILTENEGSALIKQQDGQGEEIVSWVPVRAGGEVWTIGLTTPVESILSASGSRARFDRLFWRTCMITFLCLGLMAVWGREAMRSGRAARQLEKIDQEFAFRMNEHARQVERLNQNLMDIESQHRNTEAILKRQIQRFEVLHKIDTLIAAGVDIQVTLHYLLEQAMMQRGVDAGAVYVLASDHSRLELMDGMGFHTHICAFPPVKDLDQWAGAVAFTGDILVVNNLSRNPHGWRLPAHLDQEGFVSYLALPLKANGEVKGVLELYSRSGLDESLDWVGFLEMMAGAVAIAIDNTTLVKQLQSINIELSEAYDATLEGWSRAIELHDRESEGHSQRVVELTVLLARKMHFPEDQIIHLRRGALLHDIGKMGIPDTILQKTGPLNSEERKLIQLHPEYAYRMLSPVAYLAPAMDIPYCHHERYDGKGYPRGLKGEEIPMPARVFSVVDVWDALRSDRPYRRAWSVNEARAYVRSQAGRQFDPEVVVAFLSLLDEIENSHLT